MTALLLFLCFNPTSCCNTNNQTIQNSTVQYSVDYPEPFGVGFTHTNLQTAQLFFTTGTIPLQTQQNTSQEPTQQHSSSTLRTFASTHYISSREQSAHIAEDYFLRFVVMIFVYIVTFLYYLDEIYITKQKHKRASKNKHKKRRHKHNWMTQKPHTHIKQASHQPMQARICKQRRCKQARLKMYKSKHYFWTLRLRPKYKQYTSNTQRYTHTILHHLHKTLTNRAEHTEARQTQLTPEYWRHFIGRGGGSHTTRRKRDERNSLVDLLHSTLTTWQAQQPSKKQRCNQDQSLISTLENILRESKQRNDDDSTVATNILHAIEQQHHHHPQQHKAHHSTNVVAEKHIQQQLSPKLVATTDLGTTMVVMGTKHTKTQLANRRT